MAGNSHKSVLAVKDLVKSYTGRRVVDDVSLSLESGEIVGLLGPNGAGKTTTFYIIVGLIAPETGLVSLNDRDITREPMHIRSRLGISYLPQEPSVFRKLSVKHNILAILETMEFESNHKRQKRLQELLDEFDLHSLKNNIAASLSGGERRRVEIARALARNPAFILLDEPFAGIDPIVIGDLKEMIYNMRDKGIGILITDHNVRETLGVCDRAYILADGHIIEDGSPRIIAESERARRYYLGDDFVL